MSRTFQSLQYPNYRLWISGSVVASTGIWMQRVAQDWLVLTVLTEGEGFQVGVVTALQFLPLLVLSPWAGALADRVNRRTLLQIAQTVTGLLGLILGILVLTETAELWMVYALALFGGVASSIDSPARQAFVSELVPPSSLTNAVGLNSAAFNTARLIGPAVSGLIIEQVGIGLVFIINAGLFLMPVLTLALMDSSQLRQPPRVPRARGQIREGVAYVRSRPDILAIMVVMGVVSAFGLNFQMTSALMATEVFHKQAGQYGLLGSYMAIGSLAGALLAARRARPRLRLIVVAAFFFGILEAGLALAPGYLWFALLTVPTGLAALTLITSANAAVQISTAPEIRGRVMSLYTMIFLGSTPLGAPIVGWIGQHFGARWSLGVGAIASVLVAVAIVLWGRARWDLHLQIERRPYRLRAIGPVERAEMDEAAEAAEAAEGPSGNAGNLEERRSEGSGREDTDSG